MVLLRGRTWWVDIGRPGTWWFFWDHTFAVSPDKRCWRALFFNLTVVDPAFPDRAAVEAGREAARKWLAQKDLERATSKAKRRGTQMADGYTCLGEIDAGSSLASGELLFLASLFVELGGIVEFEANLSRTLGFSDVYRCPACRAENFIRVNKPSEGLLKSLGALRVRAYELLRMKLEEAGHRRGPPIDFANFDPVLWRENGWQERVAKMIDDARTTPPPPRPGP